MHQFYHWLQEPGICRFLVPAINGKNSAMEFSLIINRAPHGTGLVFAHRAILFYPWSSASTYKFWLTGGIILLWLIPCLFGDMGIDANLRTFLESMEKMVQWNFLWSLNHMLQDMELERQGYSNNRFKRTDRFKRIVANKEVSTLYFHSKFFCISFHINQRRAYYFKFKLFVQEK